MNQPRPESSVPALATAEHFLACVDVMVDWNALEPLLATASARSGRPLTLSTFKIALLKQWYGIAEGEAPFAVLDRLSFRSFVGFNDDGTASDAAIVQELLQGTASRHPAMNELVGAVEAQLLELGYAVRAGQLREPSIAPCVASGEAPAPVGTTSLFRPGELGRMVEAVTAKAHSEGRPAVPPERPAAEFPTMELPTGELADADRLRANFSSSDRGSREGPAGHFPTANGPFAELSGADRSALNRPASDFPFPDRSGAERSSMDPAGADPSAVDQSSADHSAADHATMNRAAPDMDGAAYDRTGADFPSPDRSSASRPVSAPPHLPKAVDAETFRAVLEWPWGQTTEVTSHLHIGRDYAFSPLAHELMPYTHVSRKHAELMVYGDGVWVRDLGSRNGTYVNNEEVPKGQAYLIDGDAILRFGPLLAVSVKVSA